MLNTMCSLYSRLEKLELVKFAIDSSLEEALKKLPKLKSLTVWPDNTSEVSNVLLEHNFGKVLPTSLRSRLKCMQFRCFCL